VHHVGGVPLQAFDRPGTMLQYVSDDWKTPRFKLFGDQKLEGCGNIVARSALLPPD
jgi:hypothetical protein